jgi:type II secretory pathway pseudopilin PulG
MKIETTNTRWLLSPIRHPERIDFPWNSNRHRPRYQAFLLVEAVVSIAILAIAIAAFAQYAIIAKRYQSAHHRRLVAMRELQNTAQAIRFMPFEQLESVPQTWPLPPSTAEQFNEAKLTVERGSGQDERLRQIRFDLRFTWLEGQVSSGKPIQLSIWRFSPR